MSPRIQTLTLPYSREQLFDVAADVERYPDYLPGWVNVTILQRQGERLLVEQQLGFRFLRQALVTTAELGRPDYVRFSSEDGPFSALLLEWSFIATALGHCQVTLHIDYQLRSHTLSRVVDALFERGASEIAARFQRRAAELYGYGTLR